jgi:YD repeat-containing protein
MKILSFLILLTLPLIAISQNGTPDIVLNLEGLRKDIKDNGYNAQEIDYYDESNNLIYTISYDNNGDLEETPNGIAVIQKEYDNRGNLVQQSYYNENLLRTAPSGPAIIKYKYDQSDHKTETIYCGTNGQPLGNGLAIVRLEYDDNGNIIEKRHLDSDRKLTNRICIYKYEYDDKGRKIEERFYDNSEQIIKTGDNYESSITRYKYDNEDRIIERTYYNENNDLIEGEAKIVYDYSKEPKLKQTPSFLKDTLNKRGSGWVEQIFYDKEGNEIRRSFQLISKKN